MTSRPPVLVFLPATAPADGRFGRPPRSIPGWLGPVEHLRFEREVWYDPPTRDRVRIQFDRLPPGPRVLVGFSKSALGALSLALDQPGGFAGLLLFDGPLCRNQMPPYVGPGFWAEGHPAWLADQPLNRRHRLRQLLAHARLVHIGGEHFDHDHRALAEALPPGHPHHIYRPEPTRPHRWDSGWVEDHVHLVA